LPAGTLYPAKPEYVSDWRSGAEVEAYGAKKYMEEYMNSATFHVAVGVEDGLTFKPNQLNANIGDTIVFHFHAVNHTLTRSSLEKPCVSSGNFDSSFNQYNPAEKNDLILVITVDSLEPQWFFCRQKQPYSHCHAGMVFAINPGDEMDIFIHNAVTQSSMIPSIVTAFITETVMPSKTPTRSSAVVAPLSVQPLPSILARSTGRFMASGSSAAKFTSAGSSVSPPKIFMYLSKCLLSLECN
jgi:plastocyanin